MRNDPVDNLLRGMWANFGVWDCSRAYALESEREL